MNEDQYPRCLVWAWVAWVATLVLLTSAWIVMLIPDDIRLAFLLGGSGCMMSAVAATLHIRSFMVRVCSLIRAASYRNTDGQGLQSVG